MMIQDTEIEIINELVENEIQMKRRMDFSRRERFSGTHDVHVF